MKDFAVIFDMDGVMVNTNPYHRETIHQFCLKYGFQLSDDELKSRVYGRTNREWLTNLFGKLTDEQIETYAFEKEQLFREAYAPFIQPVQGLISFLELLRTNQIPRAIATSAPLANVEFVLKGTGTGQFFETILYDKMVQHGKPNPEIYLKTAATLGLPNNQCIVIEDSLSGIIAARNAGSKVIGITTTHTAEELHETDLIINDFDELSLQVIETLTN